MRQHNDILLADKLLLLLREHPRIPRTPKQLGLLLGVSENDIRATITVLRRDGNNIRNKHSIGFWLKDGPAPPLGNLYEDDGRWKDEPPIYDLDSSAAPR